MNIGLIGYGRMNQLVEQLATERGHSIGNIVDVDKGEIDASVDCYIDFSTAEATEASVQKCAELKVPLVLATTGWYDRKEEFEAIVKDAGATVVYAGNFSLGVNLFMQVIADAAKKFSHFSDTYDVFTHEFHHNQKVDSPGGTAIQIGETIIEHHSVKSEIQTQALDRKIKPEELHVSSTRGGSIPGIHSVTFDSDFDTIELKHTARKRDGFALGAILTAEKITELEPGFHYLPDVFTNIF